MFRTIVFLFSVALLIGTPVVHAQTANELLSRAMKSMGGEEALTSVTSLRQHLRGHEFTLDAFVRDDGSKPVEYDVLDQWLDFEGSRTRTTKEVFMAVQRGGRTITFVTDEGVGAMSVPGPDGTERSFPGRVLDVKDANEQLELHPLRLLFTARSAHDLALLPDSTLHGVDVHGVGFTWDDFEIRLFLSRQSGLPYQLDVIGARPYDFSWAMWGDMTVRTLFTDWAVVEDGIRVPYGWEITRNELPYMARMIESLELNPDVEGTPFDISESTRAAYRLRDSGPARSVQQRSQPATGVAVYADEFFGVVVVEQRDGLVLIEAPISPESTQRVLDYVRQQHPDKPVKAAIIAATALTQFGGVAAYAAAGIPVHGSAFHEEVFRRLVSASGVESWTFHPVDELVTFGQGVDRVSVFTTGGINTRNGLAVWFPGHELLYTGSLVTPIGSSTTGEQSLSEVRGALEGLGFHPSQWFSMFSPLADWPR